MLGGVYGLTAKVGVLVFGNECCVAANCGYGFVEVCILVEGAVWVRFMLVCLFGI